MSGTNDTTGAQGTATLDVDALLDDPETRIIVCCGSGGVGKTTAAAALGVRAAERGRRVVVLTIDPARRLAQSMGLTELDNTPRPVSGIDPAKGGELHAMMLDMKRTFDEIVMKHAEPDRVQQIFENPFYQVLSSSFSGTQEYMAMEKLGQLYSTNQWDLIVVDTPPSRSALDFLDAPNRLSSFLDGRFARILVNPAKAGGRFSVKIMAAGLNVVTRIIGAHLLADTQTFVEALDTMFGGFRERAEQTYQLLKAPGTKFFVVAAPESDALREASYFVERLGSERMPLAGLVLNRVHASEAASLSAERSVALAESLEDAAGLSADLFPDAKSASGADVAHGDGASPLPDVDSDPRLLAAALLRMHAERMRLVGRERRLRERFTSAHPAVPIVDVRAQPGDVHSLETLRLIGAALAGTA